MCLLPGLVSWGWIQGQEGDLAADPPQLYVVPVVSDILLELDKCLKTDENVEIGFETSVFCTKNKTTRQCFSI